MSQPIARLFHIGVGDTVDLDGVPATGRGQPVGPGRHPVPDLTVVVGIAGSMSTPDVSVATRPTWARARHRRRPTRRCCTACPPSALPGPLGAARPSRRPSSGCGPRHPDLSRGRRPRDRPPTSCPVLLAFAISRSLRRRSSSSTRDRVVLTRYRDIGDHEGRRLHAEAGDWHAARQVWRRRSRGRDRGRPRRRSPASRSSATPPSRSGCRPRSRCRPRWSSRCSAWPSRPARSQPSSPPCAPGGSARSTP